MQLNKNWKIALSIVGALFLILLFWYFSNVVLYIVIAAVVSFIGRPLMKIIEKLKIGKKAFPKSLATAITLITIISFFSVIIVVFIPIITQQAMSLKDIDYHALEEGVISKTSDFEHLLMSNNILEQPIDETINHYIATRLEKIDVQDIFSRILGLAGNFVLGAFSVLFLSFFFLKDEHLFHQIIMIFVPERYKDDANEIIKKSRFWISRYFIGILFQTMLIATFITAGSAVVGIKNALLLGVISGIFNIIPYAGPLIGACINITLVMSTNIDPNFAEVTLPLMIGYMIVHLITKFLDNFFLQPLIYSSSVKAHPIEIFIIIIMGGTVAGIPGMILAIPAYTFGRIVLGQFFSRFKIVQHLTKNMDIEEPKRPKHFPRNLRRKKDE